MFLCYRNHYSNQDIVLWACVYVCAQLLNCIQLFAAPWTAAHQAPLSMEFSRQEYWSGLPFPSPEDLPNPGIEPASPCISCTSRQFFTTVPPGKPFCDTGIRLDKYQ